MSMASLGGPSLSSSAGVGVNSAEQTRISGAAERAAESAAQAQTGAQVEGLERLLGRGLRSMSDDELLLLVNQYTQNMDIEIQQHVLGMRERAVMTRMIGAAQTAINEQVKNAGDRRDTTPLDLNAEIEIGGDDGSTQKITLGALLDRAGIRLKPNSNTLSQANVEALKANLTEAANSVRSEGEASQIGLQQLMSRRSQMLQITSNMMASRNETRKSIAQNIRG
jgi:hypothetical protein